MEGRRVAVVRTVGLTVESEESESEPVSEDSGEGSDSEEPGDGRAEMRGGR